MNASKHVNLKTYHHHIGYGPHRQHRKQRGLLFSFSLSVPLKAL